MKQARCDEWIIIMLPTEPIAYGLLTRVKILVKENKVVKICIKRKYYDQVKFRILLKIKKKNLV